MDHHNHDHMAAADMGHGGGPAAGGHRCQMSMLFTWKTQDLCLVFRWWHVSSTATLLLSLLGVIALSMGYEYVRELSRRYEARVDAHAIANGGRSRPTATRGHVGKGLFYGVQVFYSFFIMLLFMTYNGWVMIAVAVGSFLGYVIWGGSSATKSVACH